MEERCRSIGSSAGQWNSPVDDMIGTVSLVGIDRHNGERSEYVAAGSFGDVDEPIGLAGITGNFRRYVEVEQY